ncbi:MAG: leucine-rich repeat domain-containing protein [Clostridia bacterium]|nr:leucine-rich repeat domain-containing protein [Clostridia bacterium]
MIKYQGKDVTAIHYLGNAIGEIFYMGRNVFSAGGSTAYIEAFAEATDGILTYELWQEWKDKLKKVKSLVIPEGVVEVRGQEGILDNTDFWWYLFDNYKFTELTLPSTLTKLPAYLRTKKLEKINIPSANYFDNLNYDNIVEKDGEETIYHTRPPFSTELEIKGSGYGRWARLPLYVNGELVTNWTIPLAFLNKNNWSLYQYIPAGIQHLDIDTTGTESNYIVYQNGVYEVNAENYRLILGCEGTIIPNEINGLPVTSIGSSAFYGCSGLTSITIPDGVTSIGNDAFYGCSGLTSITIPDGVTSIGSSAFYGCSGLTSITIPDGVTSIESFAFSGCSGLTSITIPDGVTSIGNDAFSGCSGLTSITIPDGVTSIEGWAFYRCTNLETVRLGKGITSIGDDCFKYCNKIKTVILSKGFNYSGLNISMGNYTVEVLADIFDALAQRTTSNPGMIIIGTQNKKKITDDIQAVADSKHWLIG